MEGVIIKIKKMFIITCILLILILAAGISFASAELDNMQANDNASEIISQDSFADDLNIENEGNLANDDNAEIMQVNDNVSEIISQDNSNENLGAGEGSFDDLASEISSNTNGIIELNRDYLRNGYSNDGITIDKSLTINGKGHTLDAQSSGTIFKVTATSNVVFQNLRFINAASSAVIFKDNSNNIGFYNCIFANNTAGSGGAVTFENVFYI